MIKYNNFILLISNYFMQYNKNLDIQSIIYTSQ